MEVYDVKIDVPAACGRAMRLLEEGERSHAAVSERTGLGVGAVGILADAMARHGASSEAGWESLPHGAMFSLITSELYLVPTADTWTMARLLGEGAVGPDSAVAMFEDRAVRDLVRSGDVRRAPGGGLYLAGSGPLVAREIVDAYPGIDWAAFLRPGGSRRRARDLVGMAAPMSPPSPAAAQRGAHAP